MPGPPVRSRNEQCAQCDAGVAGRNRMSAPSMLQSVSTPPRRREQYGGNGRRSRRLLALSSRSRVVSSPRCRTWRANWAARRPQCITEKWIHVQAHPNAPRNLATFARDMTRPWVAHRRTRRRMERAVCKRPRRTLGSAARSSGIMQLSDEPSAANRRALSANARNCAPSVAPCAGHRPGAMAFRFVM